MSEMLASDYLNVISPHFPKELITTEDQNFFSYVTSQLPGGITQSLYLECRLDSGNLGVDLSLCVEGDEWDVLAGLNSDVDNPSSFLNEPTWMKVRRFCADHNNLPTQEKDKVKSFWLEFDFIQNPTGMLIPSTYFSIESYHENNYDWVKHSAIPLLMGDVLPEDVKKHLSFCLQLATTEANLIYIGVMSSRSPVMIRLCIHGMRPDRIIRYLQDVGYDISSDLIEMIFDLGAIVDGIALAIDLGERIGPRVGLECTFNRWISSPIKNPYTALTQYLINLGACTPEKRDAFWHYFGFDDQLRRTNNWPKSLIKLSEERGSQQVSTIQRNLSHIKVDYSPGKPVRAKLYLTAKHSWLSPKMVGLMSLYYRRNQMDDGVL